MFICTVSQRFRDRMCSRVKVKWKRWTVGGRHGFYSDGPISKVSRYHWAWLRQCNMLE